MGLGFPKIRATFVFVGGPIIRAIAFWRLYWGPLLREATTSLAEDVFAVVVPD